MREPATATAIMTAVLAAVRVPVTVKMRLGWDGASLNAADLACRAAVLGVAGFTVHGRTRQQFYTGAADWSAIRTVVDATSRPVVANGDITGSRTARAALEASGAAAVMIGRASIGQPWLIGSVARSLDGRERSIPGLNERGAVAAEHYDGLLTLYGHDIGRRCARKHLAAYADCAAKAGFGLAEAERRELVVADEPARVLTLLGRLYDAPMRLAA